MNAKRKMTIDIGRLTAGGDGTAFVGPFVSRKTYSASSSRAGASPPSSSREESSSSGGIKVG